MSDDSERILRENAARNAAVLKELNKRQQAQLAEQRRTAEESWREFRRQQQQ